MDSENRKTMNDKSRCAAEVYIKDCLRRTGRGRYGFEMHYNRDQCHRAPGKDGLCWQHQKHKDQGRNVRLYS